MESPEGNTVFIQGSNQDLELEKAAFLNFHPGENRCYYSPLSPGIFILNLNFKQWKSLFTLKSFQSLANRLPLGLQHQL